MTNTLILTGWGWKEYAVAAAVALRAHHGDADVLGVSKRRLPELLEGLSIQDSESGETWADGTIQEKGKDELSFSASVK